MKTDGTMEESWVKELQLFLNRSPGILIRLRGLPYECSAHQVVEFFRRGDNPAEIVDGESGVFFVKKPDGKSTGDAFVLFGDEATATAAMTKHKDLIGARYIELFRTPVTDVEQVIRRTLEAKNKVQMPRLGHHGASASALHPVPCGAARDCIRLRGLPFETQVNHLLDFLGQHAKSIVFQGVHMVYNHLGQPTGEAFVQMNSEAAASLAASSCHNGVMALGKKQRYVEVFQCSGEDMSAFLSGVVPPLSSPGAGEVMPLYSPVLESGPPGPTGLPSPVFYVIVDPRENFFTLPQPTEWLAEFPPSSVLNQPTQQILSDYFVS